MYNKISTLLLASALPATLHAQLSVQTTGMTILSGTTFSAENLVLVPSSDLGLASTTLSMSNTPVVGTSGATGINRVYSFTSPVTYNGSAGFFYSDSELGVNLESAMQIVFTSAAPGSTWTQWTTTSGSTVNTVSNFISQSFTATPLGRVTSTSSVLPLPLDLLAFSAVKADGGREALVHWTVSEEGFIPVYHIQRSKDARTFETIGTRTGIGSGKQQYAFSDQAPLEENNYYRLELADESGNKMYSKVALLQFAKGDQQAFISPNPFDQSFVLSVPEPSLAGTKVIMTDLSGKVVKEIPLSGNVLDVHTASLASGLYILTFENGTTLKVIKH